METLTLEQAARESGRSARELRLTIEAGDLPAFQRAGRWLVDPAVLEQLVTPEPPYEPAAPRLTEAPALAPDHRAAEQHPLADLLARLETRAVEVATLREQLASRRQGQGEHVERLERELSATRAELARARRRIDELEAGGERRPSPRQPVMRDALSPLFESTGAPGESGT